MDVKNVCKPQTMADIVEERRDGILAWLEANAPDCQIQQHQLDSGTDARAYWHYGYAVAMNDVLALLRQPPLDA